MRSILNKELYELLDNGDISEDDFNRIRKLSDNNLCRYLIFNQFRLIIFKEANRIIIKSVLLILSFFIAICILNVLNKINIENFGIISIVYMIVFSIFIIMTVHEFVSESMNELPKMMYKFDFIFKNIKKGE